jgi:hypothetical protein
MICVDPMRPCLTNARWLWPHSCHLFVTPDTSLERLHDFASAIGLRRQWFQCRPKGLPHYDLNSNKRALAVRYGAVEVDIDETVKAIRHWRERNCEDED